jgi:hypothetical protein
MIDCEKQGYVESTLVFLEEPPFSKGASSKPVYDRWFEAEKQVFFGGPSVPFRFCKRTESATFPFLQERAELLFIFGDPLGNRKRIQYRDRTGSH